MHDRLFQGLLAAGQSLSSGCTADPSEEAETSDSDDDSLPSAVAYRSEGSLAHFQL
jgi:hypothetical protein